MHAPQLVVISLMTLIAIALAGCTAVGQPDPDNPPPAVGESAPEFELKSLRGGTVRLSDAVEQGPVVLLVLRGYPTYQCPICSRQMGDFMSMAEQFEKLDARVLLVYPGPSEELQAKAEEFVGDQTLPRNFDLLIDPAYVFTNRYNLRWDARKETAFPSTFVIQQGEGRMIRFAEVSYTHGGRTAASDVLAEVEKLVQ